ncbi:hypothetical protein HFO56_24975 [Rhizobium laguerreae]|uniref:hypothetical protein n=1 Tax=Rhizobium laguerreae TaxID=1076926 RepID=UPI001C8FFBA6|nr:hypothetical protein [Rhizobium laguerreae]MBY3155584.1 hypothetical protein [Rhizobium laguerreae]MBY3433751.1 hypothetical protein [Rhizobium laguerreae]
MFDVIDVQKCRDIALARFEVLLSAISRGGINDATGGRMSSVTMEEAYGLARNAILDTVHYDAALAPCYIAQFPEILTMELVGATVSDSIEQALRRAVFAGIEDDVHQAVATQFTNYGVDELTHAVSTGLAMFDRYLTKHPFASMRIKPEKVLSQLAAVIETGGVDEMKLLMGQIGNLISELKAGPTDARHAARALREANQCCALLIANELSFASEHKPAPVYALAS